MTFVSKLLVVIAIPFLAASCAQQGNVQATNAASYSNFKKGVTTKKQVHAALGQPHDVRKQSGGSRWSYYHVTMKMNGMGLIPFAGLFLPGTNTTSNVGLVYFDPNDRYLSVNTKSSSDMQNSFAQLGRAADSLGTDTQHVRVSEEMSRLGLPFDKKEAMKAKDAGTVLGANPEY